MIAVTGIGIVSPFGQGVEPLEAGLLDCRSCVERSDIFAADFNFARTAGQVRVPLDNVEPRPGFRFSRTDRLALLAARDIANQVDPECGVAIATTVGGLSSLRPSIATNPREYYRAGGFSAAAPYARGHVADVVACHLGLRGPRLGLNVACASGAMAIALAAEMILDGSAPMMLAGGSDALCEFTLGGFHSLQALDPEPCRPFDVSRNGLNLGEGAAVLLLEDLGRARTRGAHVWAVLRGWGMTNDAFHLTAPHEKGVGLAASIARAAEMAGVEPGEIGYVNAHGTGTPANDIAEANAYAAAFDGCRRPVPVSSTKSYTGHTLAAAGSIEAVVTILSLRLGVLFPTLRLSDPIECPQVDWLRGEPRREALQFALTASAGFGGTNTSLLFENPGQYTHLPITGRSTFAKTARKSVNECTVPGFVISGMGSVSRFGPQQGPIHQREPQGDFVVVPFRPASVVPGLKTRRLDRLSVWSLVAASLALRDAGIETERLDHSRCAVVLGSGLGCIETTEAFFRTVAASGYAMADPILFPDSLDNAPASHVARHFGFTGPNLAMSCRGVSGEAALIEAASLLRTGAADLVVVLAGDTLTLPLREWLDAAGARFQSGEGLAALVMQPARDAKVSYATFQRGALGGDPGATGSSWARDSRALARAMRTALGENDPSSIQWIVSCANGSHAPDRMEAEAIRDVFEDRPPARVVTPKSILGEFDGSAALRLAVALPEVSGLGIILGASAGGGCAAVLMSAP
jgi:3-oxoacyl-[acyl-carrier-protein] synthase II